jgi:hypothetical protein
MKNGTLRLIPPVLSVQRKSRGALRTRAARPVLIALVASLVFVTSSQVLAQTTLSGRTLDLRSESPIGAAEVELLDARERRIARVMADSSGVFVFESTRSGTYRLRVSAPGYRRVTTPELAVAAEPVDVVVRLAIDVVPLAPLEVRTRPAPLARHPGLADFYRRAELKMGGTFIKAEEIEIRNPTRVTDLFTAVPSFTVVQSAGLLVNNRSNCAPAIFLDGVRMRPEPIYGRTAADVGYNQSSGMTPAQAFHTANVVQPVELEGIEIYAGAASIPGQYAGAASMCGVIVMWTKRGPPR